MGIVRSGCGLVALLVSASASAGVTVDWEKGLVTADAVGVADRHAPNPAVARGTSRRGAEDVAKKQIAEKLKELPVAGGGKVASKLDKPGRARLASAVDHAITVDAEPGTDGSWRVTMAVPIEAVRQALPSGGPRSLGDQGDSGPPVVILDGAGAAKPAVGWKINGEGAAIVWVKDLPAWATSAPHASATKIHGGAIDVAGITAAPGTLFVIVR